MLVPTLMSLLVRAYISVKLRETTIRKYNNSKNNQNPAQRLTKTHNCLLENLVRRGTTTECLRPLTDNLDENAADKLTEGERESLMVVISAIDAVGEVNGRGREKERERETEISLQV